MSELLFCERLRISGSFSHNKFKKPDNFTEIVGFLNFFVELQLIVCKPSQKSNYIW